MRLRPAESRVLALLLLFPALALVYLLLVHWWFVAPQRELSAQMQDLRDDEHRYAAIIAQRDSLRSRLAELSRDASTSSAFLAGNDPSAASAALMQQVVDTVRRHTDAGSCEVTQKMPVAGSGESKAPYRRIRVNLNLSCGVTPLADVLYDLEHGTPYLFVDNLSIYRSPISQQGKLLPLQVQFTLSGYIRNAGGGAP